MPEELGIEDVIKYAALVYLHKQLSSVAEIRLTSFDFISLGEADQDGIQLQYDKENGDVVLHHVQKRSDA